MTTARYLVGDVYDRLAQLEPGSVDVALTSPPFLALRSYLPDSHPDKAREIGSEGTPGAFIDVLLEWTAAVGRVLAPHGSLVVELGDTYAGSGGAGGDYLANGNRAEQPVFAGSAKFARVHDPAKGPPILDRNGKTQGGGDGWPLVKSLAGIPQAYQLSLAYGRNVLTGAPSPAGRWIIRNVKPWIRSNPPVGALGDKERPATSYVIVATRAPDRYFDLDAVRTTAATAAHHERYHAGGRHREAMNVKARDGDLGSARGNGATNAAGAPPRDWWHHVDAILDAELDRLAGTTKTGPITVSPSGASRGISGGDSGNAGKPRGPGSVTQGARGVHLRRALERAGILTTLDALDVSPKGYAGAHYAVWPKELVRLLLAEMCPARVCTTCRHPSRRIAETTNAYGHAVDHKAHRPDMLGRTGLASRSAPDVPKMAERRTLGWSDCGHSTWRPGRVCDPFAGSGTTLAVASGMGFDSVGIDIDYRNASLALERVGMFLDVWWPDHNGLPALPAGRPSRRYEEWAHLMDDVARHVLGLLVDLLAGARHDPPVPDPVRARNARAARNVRAIVGQTDLFTPQETPT